MMVEGSVEGRPLTYTGSFATVRVHPGCRLCTKTYKNRVSAGDDDRQAVHMLHISNEVRLVSSLDHPHIICPFAVRCLPDVVELDMKFAVHGTLEEYARKFGDTSTGLPEREGARIFGQICDALEYLHDKGIVHRDIKLSNVVLDEDWEAQICDFGSARSATWPEGAVQRGLLLMGAPGYMAPEVLGAAITGEAGFDMRASDMWSAGVCLFSLFHRSELPFKGRNAYELQESLEVGHLPFRAKLSRGLMDLTRALLSREASRRPTARDARTHPWVAGSGGDRGAAQGATATFADYVEATKRHMAATAAEGRKAHHAAAEAHIKAAQALAAKYNVMLPLQPTPSRRGTTTARPTS